MGNHRRVLGGGKVPQPEREKGFFQSLWVARQEHYGEACDIGELA